MKEKVENFDCEQENSFKIKSLELFSNWKKVHWIGPKIDFKS